jgi:hypothetical protein
MPINIVVGILNWEMSNPLGIQLGKLICSSGIRLKLMDRLDADMIPS